MFARELKRTAYDFYLPELKSRSVKISKEQAKLFRANHEQKNLE